MESVDQSFDDLSAPEVESAEEPAQSQEQEQPEETSTPSHTPSDEDQDLDTLEGSMETNRAIASVMDGDSYR
jgi:hypothetical protein